METPQIDSTRIAQASRGALDRADIERREKVFSVSDLAVHYSGKPAIEDVSIDVFRNTVTAFIGPSGCGKSTFIRCFNRMNDLIPGAKVSGTVLYHGADLYGRDVDPVDLRRRIGMVFQKPNPFPKSIYDNVAFGPRVLGLKGSLDERVEKASARRGALGRGQGPAEGRRSRAVGRPAAAALHRARARGRAGRDPHGRARVGARSDLDDTHRGSDARSEARVHDRDRDPQHAAGRARRRHDRLLQRGRRTRTAAPGAGSWSSTTRRRRSSRPLPTSARRTT